VLLTLGLMSASLVAASGPSASAQTTGADVPKDYGAPQDALIERYHRSEPNGEGGKDLSISDILYQPRSFVNGADADSYRYGSTIVTDPGNYEGWDILSPPNYSDNKTGKWMYLTLNRRAQVALVLISTTARTPSTRRRSVRGSAQSAVPT
jgi:hypothetical protein